MKVKVNGEWKDHVAFVKRENVGDVAVLEGEITLASVNYLIKVTHNIGKKAIFAEVELIGGTTETWTPFYAFINIYSGGAVVTNGSGGISCTTQEKTYSDDTNWNPVNNENFVQFHTIQTTSYKFPVGTYKYKIYYEL